MTGRAPKRTPGQARRGGPPLFARGGGVSVLLALAGLLLSILGALNLTAAATAVDTLRAWPGRLAGSITVATGGQGIESSDAAAARAAEILSQAPGLADVRVLDAAPGDTLAGRLLGLADPARGADAGADGPPRLLTARFAGPDHPTAAALAATLRGAGLNAAVDDHGPWSGPLERAAVFAAAAAAGVCLVLLGAMAVVSARIAARRLRRQAARARLLVQLGATETMLSRPVSGAAAAAAVLLACLGAAAAAGAAASLAWIPIVSTWVDAWVAVRGLPTPAPNGLTVAAAVVWPIAVAPLAAWASGAAARAAVRKLS